MSVSPDDGFGAWMSFLRFEDQSDGVHVFFDDVTDPGPLGSVASFNETDIATLTRPVQHRRSHRRIAARHRAHSIKFSLDLKPGPANDVVKIYIDGVLTTTGTTWEDDYRYDPEQTGGGNQVPTVDKLLFRESGIANPADSGQGFLVDGVSLLSSNPPANKRDCKRDGWKTHTRADGSVFKNQRACIKYVKKGADGHARH